MVVGSEPDNAGGRGFVRGGGPRPSLRVVLVFVTEIFCPRGRVGRPVPASAMVGSLDGCVDSWRSSVSVGSLRLREVTAGREKENEAGILGDTLTALATICCPSESVLVRVDASVT